MSKATWKPEDTPDRPSAIAIVTGANTGLGYQTTKTLAGKGVTVIMACRNLKKAKTARENVEIMHPAATVKEMKLDLADFKSLREFAKKFNEKYDKLDLLINNAGVMMPPYELTKDGHELQWQANYLGHFLLTGLLLEKIKATANARVITLSSIAHKWGDIYFEDHDFKKKYDKQKAYGQSKLACLMFAYALQRRFKNKNIKAVSLAAHPGVSNTELSRHMPRFMQFLQPLLGSVITQSPESGAQPTLRAALDTQVKGGEFMGPAGRGGFRGKPVQVDSTPTSKDKAKAKKLWKVSEKLTGVEYLDE